MSSHSKMILLMIHYPRAHKMWSLDQQYQHHVGTRWKYKLSCPTLESESETMRVGSSFPTLTNHTVILMSLKFGKQCITQFFKTGTTVDEEAPFKFKYFYIRKEVLNFHIKKYTFSSV